MDRQAGQVKELEERLSAAAKEQAQFRKNLAELEETIGTQKKQMSDALDQLTETGAKLATAELLVEDTKVSVCKSDPLNSNPQTKMLICAG